MSSIPEADGDNESMPSNTPREVVVSPSRSPITAANRRKHGDNIISAESKDSSPTSKKVSSQMKSLQDTLEEVLKSELDSRKQWEEIGAAAVFQGGPLVRSTSVTNTVSLKAKGSKKIPRKRNPPAQIKLESLTSITEADTRLETESSKTPVDNLKSSGHHRISSDVSISALSDDSSGYHASASPLPKPVAEALGMAQVKEMLTVQQQRSIGALYDLLRRGVNVMKHGRTGRPKLRRLFCDEKLTILFWREAEAQNGVRKSIDNTSGATLHTAIITNETDDGIHEITAAEEEDRRPKKRRSSFLR